jgi:hypothetical protein
VPGSPFKCAGARRPVEETDRHRLDPQRRASPRLHGGPDTANATLTACCGDRAGNPSPRAFALKYDATPPPLSDRAVRPNGGVGVIVQRPGVTLTEIAQVLGISMPLIYNTTRAGVERGDLTGSRCLAASMGSGWQEAGRPHLLSG